MFRKIGLVIGSLALAFGVLASESPARAQGTARVGTLSCNVASGWGFCIRFVQGAPLHLFVLVGPYRILYRQYSEIRGRYRLYTRRCAYLGGACTDLRSGAGRAGGRICRRHRKRHGGGWGRGQCIGRRFQPNNFASAAQSRRQHRSQCRGWHRSDQPAPRAERRSSISALETKADEPSPIPSRHRPFFGMTKSR